MRPHEHYTDEELVQLLLTTQDEALREGLCVEFVARFGPVIAVSIRRCLLRRTPRAERTLVEDLTQDTFKKICNCNFKILHKFEFRCETALRSYLKVIAHNIAEDYWRTQKAVFVQLDDTQPDSSDSYRDVERRNRIEMIERCLQQLAGKPNFDRDYKIFRLYFCDGYTAQAISQLPDIGLSVKGVESTLLRLIKWLRDKLK
jgi:RNA polymerase sigma factor (sigma-70 family)